MCLQADKAPYVCDIVLFVERSGEYMYVSFMGTGATVLMNHLNISLDTPVYHGYSELIGFWKESIKRINQLNSNVLSESVLLYTLSFINSAANTALKANSENTLSTIVDYVNTHYRDADISLKKIAYVFFSLPSRGSFHLSFTVLLHYRSSGSI